MMNAEGAESYGAIAHAALRRGMSQLNWMDAARLEQWSSMPDAMQRAWNAAFSAAIKAYLHDDLESRALRLIEGNMV